MTLLATEIHNHNIPDQAIIIFVADRRISYSNGTYADTRRKIFRVPMLNAGIGYFGLAEIPQKTSNVPMSIWLKEFIKGSKGLPTLKDFSKTLAAELNTAVPKNRRTSEHSGFHIAGFSAQAKPEFWFVRNVADDRKTLLGNYQAREDFQGRDAPKLAHGAFQIYRNGDIRAHVVAWEAMDNSFGALLSFPDFKPLTTPEEYVEWVKFKMRVIAKFYKKFCKYSIIGTPIDAFAIRK